MRLLMISLTVFALLSPAVRTQMNQNSEWRRFYLYFSMEREKERAKQHEYEEFIARKEQQERIRSNSILLYSKAYQLVVKARSYYQSNVQRNVFAVDDTPTPEELEQLAKDIRKLARQLKHDTP